jgi:hypothetical protein
MRTYARLGLLLTAAVALGVVAGRGTPAYAWTYPASLKANATTDGSSTDRYPQVTTDGVGNWVAVWASDDPTGTIGIDWDILMTRSTDNGATWSAAAPLNGHAATDGSERDDWPQVTTDGAVNWVAVWESTMFAGGDYDILVARSTDAGGTWTPATVLNYSPPEETGADHRPQVATDGGGNWVAVWTSNEDLNDPILGQIGADYDILVARSIDNGATWTPSVALNTNAATDSGQDRWDPQVTTDGLGNWVAVWDSTEPNVGSGIGTDEDILVARSTDNGATWTDPVALNAHAGSDPSNGYDSHPQVTTDGGGHWVAVWQAANWHTPAYEIAVARSTDNGATWTAAAPLDPATTSATDERPQVTTDGAGNWVAVWDSDETLGGTIVGKNILFSRSTDNGTSWSAAAPLNTNAGTDAHGQWFPQVTTDGFGTWVTVWQCEYCLNTTLGTDWDLLYANEWPGAVGGMAELPEVSGSAGYNYMALVALAAALVALGAGGWYARMRWLG